MLTFRLSSSQIHRHQMRLSTTVFSICRRVVQVQVKYALLIIKRNSCVCNSDNINQRYFISETHLCINYCYTQTQRILISIDSKGIGRKGVSSLLSLCNRLAIQSPEIKIGYHCQNAHTSAFQASVHLPCSNLSKK